MRKLRAAIGWTSILLFYAVLGSMERDGIPIADGVVICIILLALFTWGGIPWHKKF